MSRDLHEQHSRSDPGYIDEDERTELVDPARSTKLRSAGSRNNGEEAENFIEQDEDLPESIA
jgi:hypothetical protein